MIINKIKIPLKQISFTMVSVCLYLVIAYVGQTYFPIEGNNVAVYAANLNFGCDKNVVAIAGLNETVIGGKNETKFIYSKLYSNTCNFYWQDATENKTVSTDGNNSLPTTCWPLYENYLCPTTDCLTGGKDFCSNSNSTLYTGDMVYDVGVWDSWTNCWCFITVYVVSSILAFLLMWGLHYLKAKTTRPFKGPSREHLLGVK